MRKLVLVPFLLVLSACQWVKTTEGGENVSLVKMAHVVNCEKLGTTTSSVKDSIGFIDRKERKVMDELVTLAKNDAANMGGDTIVANKAISSGSQEFAVYRCQ